MSSVGVALLDVLDLVVVGSGVQVVVCFVVLGGGGTQVDVGFGLGLGVGLGVGLGAGAGAASVNSQSPKMIPAEAGAKNWKSPSVKSRPFSGHPGH